jgi:hypothetical protein
MRNILILILICAFAIPVSQPEKLEITESVVNIIPDPVVADDESDQCDEVIKITKKKRLIRLFRRK